MITNPLFRECLAQIPTQVRRKFDFVFAVADRISELMDKKGITKTELAKQTGKTEALVSEWLTGRYNFTLSEIADISEVLGEPILDVERSKRQVFDFPIQ